MTNRPQKKNVSIQQVLAALLDEQNVFPPSYMHHFSDLEGADLEAVRSIWPQVGASRRFTLLEDLEELSEVDTLVSFDNLATMALQDPDPRVRTVAIRMLWESEDPRLAPVLMKMLVEDENTDVRAAAATGLGKYIYLGELEELQEDLFHQVEASLLAVLSGKDEALVRRRALESMGFSGREEVPPFIRSAYQSGDTDWISSALFAMGRSADPVWAPDVKRMLRSAKANIQLEAVRAAGELELDSTRRILLDLLEEEAQDSDIQAAIIWSLSQIGGEEVRETLEKMLEETEDDEDVAILEDALDNLSFTEDTGLYSMLDMNSLGITGEEIEEEYISPEDMQGSGGEDGDEDTPGSAGDALDDSAQPKQG